MRGTMLSRKVEEELEIAFREFGLALTRRPYFCGLAFGSGGVPGFLSFC